MRGHGSQIGKRQEAAIAALLTQSSTAKAAEKAGVPYRTLKRWLTDADFMAAYRLERRRLVEQAVGRMQQATAFAVTALLALLKDGTESIRLAAAKTLIEHSRDAIEVAEVMERLEVLEGKLLLGSTPSTNGGMKR
jgi:hypothetical protein